MSILDDENILLNDDKSIQKDKIKIIEDIINTPHTIMTRSTLSLSDIPPYMIFKDQEELLWELNDNCIDLNKKYFTNKSFEIPTVAAPLGKTPILLLSRMFSKQDINLSVNLLYDSSIEKINKLKELGINKINFWNYLNKLCYIGNIYDHYNNVKNADNIEIIDNLIHNYQDKNIEKDISIDLGDSLKKQFPKLKGIMRLNTDTFILGPNTKELQISQINIRPDINTEPKIYINIDGDPISLTFKDVYLIYNFDNIMMDRHLNNYLYSQIGDNLDLGSLLAERDKMDFLVNEIKNFFKNNPYITDIFLEQNLNLCDEFVKYNELGGSSNKEKISLKTLIQKYDNSEI